MDCKDVRESLVAYVDRELPPEEAASVERHLKGCRECEAEHRKVARFTTSVVELLEPLRPARSFREAVMTTVTVGERSGVAAGAPARGKLRGWMLAAVAAAVAAALCGALVALLVRGEGRAGRLAVEAGTARVLRWRDGAWELVPGATEVTGGERVETEAASRAVVAFEGAAVTLNERTSAQMEFARGGLSVRFASTGEVYAVANTLREFRVVANDVSVSFEHGKTNIKILSDGTVVVSAVEAAVRVSNPD